MSKINLFDVYGNPTKVEDVNKGIATSSENIEDKKVGLRYNEEKLRWRNFPMFLMEPLVEVGAHAEKRPGNPTGKYPTFNFLKGMKVNDCLDCAKRHMMKAESPYHSDLDEETKVHHLAHAAWNLLVALHNIKTRPDLDDRYKTNEAQGKDPK